MNIYDFIKISFLNSDRFQPKMNAFEVMTVYTTAWMNCGLIKYLVYLILVHVVNWILT